MIKRLTHFIIILAPVVLFIWLLLIDIAPGGNFSVSVPVDSDSPFVDRLLPDDRVLGVQYNRLGEAFVSIINDPVYFSVHLPNTDFETVSVEVEFLPHDQRIIELGGLVDIFSQGYDLRPLFSKILEESTWEELREDGRILLQRVKKFETIADFIATQPERSTIATYHSELPWRFRFSQYKPLGYTQSVDVSLRGSHKYITYLKNEDFRLSVMFMDMNRTTGADSGAVRVWNEEGEVVLEKIFKDDGNEIENQISSTTTLSLDQNDLPEGVYEVELSGTSDIFWRVLETPQKYLTFVDKLYIGDDIGHEAEIRATKFYTNAKYLSLETFHADATQRVEIGSEVILVPYSHQKVEAKISDLGVVQGFTPSGDVLIVGEGKFAFTRDAFFDPYPIELGSFTDLDALGMDYVFSTYQPVRQNQNWQTAMATFVISELASQDNSLKFTLSMPAIITHQTMVDVHAINLTFSKKPMTIWEFIKNLVTYIPGI